MKSPVPSSLIWNYNLTIPDYNLKVLNFIVLYKYSIHYCAIVSHSVLRPFLHHICLFFRSKHFCCYFFNQDSLMSKYTGFSKDAGPPWPEASLFLAFHSLYCGMRTPSNKAAPTTKAIQAAKAAMAPFLPLLLLVCCSGASPSPWTPIGASIQSPGESKSAGTGWRTDLLEVVFFHLGSSLFRLVKM